MNVGLAERRTDALSRLAGKQPLAVINARALLELVDLDEAIILVRRAMRDLSANRIDAPERWAMPAGNAGLLALMPGAMPTRGRFGIKVLSLFDTSDNGPIVPGHQGLMLLFDADDGRPLCIVDAHVLTALRTAAASAAATDLLAHADARTVAIIGAGEQARWHVRALCRVRAILQIRVWSRSPESLRAFAADVADQGVQVIACASARDAVDSADIVCTVTRAREPVVLGEWLVPGQHLNLVGSSTRDTREVDEDVVARSRFIVDSRANVLSQGGEFRAAIASGAVTSAHIHAEIGDVLAGTVRGRENDAMITVYKSLGHVAQDLVIAMAVHERAARSAHTVWADW